MNSLLHMLTFSIHLMSVAVAPALDQQHRQRKVDLNRDIELLMHALEVCYVHC